MIFYYRNWAIPFIKNGEKALVIATYLVFVQTEEKHAETAYHRGRTGLNHLAFHGKSRKQIDNLTEKLISRGTTILYKDRHPYAGGNQTYAVFFEDPDRIKLEIVAPE